MSFETRNHTFRLSPCRMTTLGTVTPVDEDELLALLNQNPTFASSATMREKCHWTCEFSSQKSSWQDLLGVAEFFRGLYF
jgi:hypothetical protein